MKTIFRYSRRFLLVAIITAIIILNIGIIAMATGDPENQAKTPGLTLPFKDVALNDPNALFIKYISQKGIITGYPDGTYHSQEGLTRAQAAAVICKASGLKVTPVTQSPFKDLPAGHWAAPQVAAAVKAGYIKGLPDGTYKPEDKLTRAQGIALIMRLCTQKEKAPLPALADMNSQHWAAADMGTALAAEMIGLSEDKQHIYPEAQMSRGSLARALAILLTKDPGLNQAKLTGTLTEIKGEVTLTRNNKTDNLINDITICEADIIKTGKDSKARIVYPDGSGTLIEENSEVIIKKADGRSYIKQDGTAGVAVEFLNIDLTKGTLFGALATKREQYNEETEKKQAGQSALFASRESLRQLAAAQNDKAQPWYQTAEKKKVKVKVDMPWGVAAIRGTFIKVSVNMDGSCNVSCLTGSAEVSGSGSSGSVPLGGGQSSGITGQGQGAAPAVPISQQDKADFSKVQDWVVNTALQIDVNQEIKPVAEVVVEVPDNQTTKELVETTVKAVIDALKASGIDVKQEVLDKLPEQVKETLDAGKNTNSDNNKSNNNSNSINNSGSNSEGGGSSSAYIAYNTAGTYGGDTASAVQTIAGTAVVNVPGVTLRNLIITGTLVLAAGIGEGNVSLNNVTVRGNTVINGGGANSIELIDCSLYTVTIDKANNSVRIVAKGSTSVGELTLNSGAKLEEEPGLSGPGFSSVTTGLSIPAGATIILSGNFAALNIAAPGLGIQVAGGSIEQMNIASTASGTALTLAPGTSVSNLQVNAQASIGGAGQIINAAINSAGVEMQQLPQNWIVAPGVNDARLGGAIREGSSNNNTRLASISLSSGTLNPVFAPTILNYNASVANSVYQVTLSVIPQETTAAIKINDVSKSDNTHILNLNVGANPITIVVTAQDGSSLSYILTVTRAASNTKAITAFHFNGLNPAVSGSIDVELKTIALTVPYGTDVTALVPSITHTGTSISPTSEAAQDFSSPVSYRVTAADGSTRDYLVTVTVRANPAKAITAFSFAGLSPAVEGSIDVELKTIALTVPYGTDVTALVPSITHTGASINPTSEAAQDFSSPVSYRVTAADGSTQDYLVTVTVRANPAKAITAFSFAGLSPAVEGSIDVELKTIALTVPYGTDVTALVPSITHTGASINPTSEAAQDFSSPVSYRVTAADGSTRDYLVTVTVRDNHAKAITGFSFDCLDPAVEGSIDVELKTITLTVPPGTSVCALVPSITHTGASISPDNETPQDFSNPVNYTVTADDDSTQAYTVTVNVTPGIAANFANSLKTYTTTKFTWTAATGASLVKIKVSPKGQNDWVDATTKETLGQTSTEGTVTGLNVSTSYDFKLVVTDGSLDGESNIVNITTMTHQEAINYVNAAIGNEGLAYGIKVETLNAASGQSNAIVSNEHAYDTAICNATNNSLDTAAKIQMLVNNVNVAKAKEAAGITCADIASTPTVTLQRPTDSLDGSGVTFAFTARKDSGVSTDISDGSNAVITRGSGGFSLVTLTITCAVGGQTVTDTKVYSVNVPAATGNVTWVVAAPELTGYTVAPGTVTGSIKITYTLEDIYLSLEYVRQTGPIIAPAANDPSNGTSYNSGENITGVNAGDHIGLYLANNCGQYVSKFVDIILVAEDIATPAGKAGAPTGADIGNDGNGSDMRVTFDKASDETGVNEYRIIVYAFPDADLNLNLAAAEAVSTGNYTAVTPNGSASYTITLDANTKDSDGNLITNREYKLYILSVKKAPATCNSLSDWSYVTLTTP